METALHFAALYATLFATAGITGAVWYLGKLSVGRKPFSPLVLAVSVLTPGVIAVVTGALTYGETLDEHFHQAFGYSGLIGISGAPGWAIASAGARTIVEQIKRIKVTWSD